MKKAALFLSISLFGSVHFWRQPSVTTAKAEQQKKRKKKPLRRRSEQFAHYNMCDYRHHNGSHRCSEVSLVSSSHVSEQLMCSTRCNRSSCPGRAGAWPPGSSFAWHGDVLFSPAKKMEKLDVKKKEPHRFCKELLGGLLTFLCFSLTL